MNANKFVEMGWYLISNAMMGIPWMVMVVAPHAQNKMDLGALRYHQVFVK